MWYFPNPEEDTHVRQVKKSFTAGVVVGLVAGLTAGMVTVAHSTTGKKAWERFGDMFQAGYVAGFQDAVRIAKAMDQEGYVARAYVLPEGAKPTHYQAWVNDAYKDAKYSEKTVPQLLVLAGYKLEATFGPELPANNVGLEGLRSVIESRRAAMREAMQAEKDLQAEKAADATKTGDAAKAEEPTAPSGQ
jgi:hypothetical protein